MIVVPDPEPIILPSEVEYAAGTIVIAPWGEEFTVVGVGTCPSKYLERHGIHPIARYTGEVVYVLEYDDPGGVKRSTFGTLETVHRTYRARKKDLST